MDPNARSAKACALADLIAVKNPGRSIDRLRGGRLGGGRNGCDRLQDLRSDLVGVALRVRTAVFQIALVGVVDEGVRHADRGATIGYTPGECVDRGGLG